MKLNNGSDAAHTSVVRADWLVILHDIIRIVQLAQIYIASILQALGIRMPLPHKSYMPGRFTTQHILIYAPTTHTTPG